MDRSDYGLDLTRNAGWYLSVVGWRQLLMLWLGLVLAYFWGVVIGRWTP